MATRTYETDELQVTWDAQRCVHFAACIRALPAVFNPIARPWIRVEGADTEQLVAAIERCPTGALRYVRKAGDDEEAPLQPTTITPIEDGPLVVRGDLHLTTPTGETVVRETRLVLCRCGASANKPFCDSSHLRVGFRSGETPGAPATSEGREHAESPHDIGPAQPA